MSAYNSDLNYLFNLQQEGKKAYYVDSLLYNYTENSTVFNNNLPLSDYFVAISGINFSFELSVDVDKYLREVGSLPTSPVVKTFLATKATAAVQPSCPTNAAGNASQAPNAGEIIRAATFEGDPDTNEVVVNLTENRNGETVLATKRIVLNNLFNNIKTVGSSLLAGHAYTRQALTNRLRVATHTEFDRYLSEINSTISYSYLDASRLLLPDTPTNVSMIQDQAARNRALEADRIRIQAVRSLKSFYGNKYASLRETLRTNCRKSLETIASGLTIDESTNFLSAFANRSAMASGSFKQYYILLRSIMCDTFTIPVDIHYENDRKVDRFMKKTLVDLYLKTCYPLIHYDFIDILLRKYTALGDFVNARFALLAKVMFTYYVVDNLVGSLESVPPEISEDLTTNLYNYIVRNNKGDIHASGSREDKVKAIVMELHQMSNEVWSTSNTNTIISKGIRDNQLTLRALIENNKIVQKEVSVKALKYYISLALLFVLIVVFATLMFFGMYDYAMMFVGVEAAAILVFLLATWIIAIIRKN